jgi:hypothetical protein
MAGQRLMASAMEVSMGFDGRYNAAMINTRSWTVAVLAACSVASFAGNAFAAQQRSFASPQEASTALIQAVKSQDRNAVLAVLGQDAAEWISSGDAAADRAAVARFTAAAKEKNGIVPKGDNAATLTLGSDDFPFAFPIVRKNGRWRFDTAAGKEEMLARRIGDNELSAIKVMEAIVDAELEYATVDRDGDGLLTYAQRFESTAGKHDGLYWPAKQGEAASPLGPLLAQAEGEGFQKTEKSPTPYHGYYYRMLSGQGKYAPSGAIDYVIKGHAIGGFAVVAYPARYGNSGIMTFIVNQDGKIYQSDLGPDTQAKALQLKQFDPGPGWVPVKDQ